LMWSAILVLRI